MSANLENSAVAKGLKKARFHSNPKEGQCQTMFKLLYNCAHFTCQQGYVQNPSSWASAVHETRTSRYKNQIQKRQRKQRSNWQHSLDHGEGKGVPEKHLLLLQFYAKAFACVITTNWKILKEMGIPDHLTCLLKNMYACSRSNSQNWTWNK